MEAEVDDKDQNVADETTPMYTTRDRQSLPSDFSLYAAKIQGVSDCETETPKGGTLMFSCPNDESLRQQALVPARLPSQTGRSKGTSAKRKMKTVSASDGHQHGTGARVQENSAARAGTSDEPHVNTSVLKQTC